MAEFRADDCDNVADLLDYMDEEGYLGVDAHPEHAIAVLRFAEAHRIKDAYIHAYTHCAGMSEHLEAVAEYEHVSLVSKRLIRRGRLEMDQRLGRAGKLLQTFLEDDLGEPTVMLAPGARAHLDRFRSFLLSFYSSRMGYYPPPAVDGRPNMFERHVYQSMHEDFRALYEYLVDETSTASDRVAADGGLSVIQCVLAFDSRRRYLTLDHPFPLLPQARSSAPGGRRQAWLSRGDKLSPDQRLLAYAALVRASNMDPRVLDNGLVKAYRKFEEHTVAPATRVDRGEKIGLVEARKVRWLLVYSAYQVLRQCVRVAPEVSDTDVDYNLCVSVDGLPPWEAGNEFVSPTMTQASWGSEEEDALFSHLMDSMGAEVEVDHQVVPRPAETLQFPPSSSWTLPSTSASSGLAANARRKSSSGKSAPRPFARSMSLFNKRTEPATAPSTPSRRNSMYHEIVVHRYGNGTNAVTEPVPKPPPVPALPLSATASSTAEVKPAAVPVDIPAAVPVNIPAAIKPAPPALPEIDTAAAAAYRVPSVRASSRSSYSSSVYTDEEDDTSPASSRVSSMGTADTSLPSGSPRSSKLAPSPVVCEGPPILSPIPLRSRRREVESMMSDSEGAADEAEAQAEAEAESPDYAKGYEDLVREERDRAELCPAPLQIRKAASVASNRRRPSFTNTPPEAYPVQGCASAIPAFGTRQQVVRGRRRGRQW